MGRTAKVDYTALEKEYVTGDISLRELAKEHDISWSAVASQARKTDNMGAGWNDKRQAFRESVSRKAMAKTSDRFATEDADIRAELVNVNRATLAVYIQQLREGGIRVTPGDAVKATTALLTLLGEPTSRTETTIVDIHGTGRLSSEELRKLAEFARSRIVEGTVADAAEPVPEGTLEG